MNGSLIRSVCSPKVVGVVILSIFLIFYQNATHSNQLWKIQLPPKGRVHNSSQIFDEHKDKPIVVDGHKDKLSVDDERNEKPSVGDEHIEKRIVDGERKEKPSVVDESNKKRIVDDEHKEKPSVNEQHKGKPTVDDEHKEKLILDDEHKEKPIGSKPIVIDGHKDKQSDDILSVGIEGRSCLSRYQSVLYRKPSLHKPSSYLLSKLLKYEALHKKCGPYTESYNKTFRKLKSGNKVKPTDCNYVVWKPINGLGNRMLSIASTFLYSLLANKILLVQGVAEMGDLFCEPFRESSWLLPLAFPLNKLSKANKKSSHGYGNMPIVTSINGSTASLPPFLHINLAKGYDDRDKLFFCDQYQTLLQKVPLLIVRSNQYFLPSLFLIPSFERELSNLFPSKETVFQDLGRYLFNPSNAVWGMIVRYYKANLAYADERVGLQIRIFNSRKGSFPNVLDQIRACFLKGKLLPEVSNQETIVAPLKNKKSKAVLVTSLSSWFSENIRKMYWENPTVTGEVISVYQPSDEQYQQNGKMHNRKAWAEMYLLSLTDVLITTSSSTFGYVAQGLGGLRPWILVTFKNVTTQNPPCRHAVSMEPCFHYPPGIDCKTKTRVDTLVPFMRHCEDKSQGVKLVGRVRL